MFTESLSLGWQVSLVGIWLGSIILLAESLNRLARIPAEISRKIVHIGTGNVILLAWWLHIPMWIGVSASVVAGAIALLSYKYHLLPSVDGVGRHSLGTFFYAVTMGILIAWFWSIQQPAYAVIGILVMTWGDGLAAVIGERWGKHRYEVWGMKKSWEGTTTMFIVSFFICSLILLIIQGNIWQTWLIALLVGVICTTMETISKFGIDNLTVPFSAATVSFYLNYWW
jgi:phytol kinase